MQFTDLLVVESDADLEQAMPTLLGHRDRVRSRGLLVIGIVVGLAAMLACTVGFSTVPGHAAGEVTAAAPGLGRLSGLVQAYALERGGRKLTSGDVQALHTRLAGSKHVKARKLLDRLSKASSLGSENKNHAEELGLSEECMEAAKSKLEEIVSYFAQVLVETFFGCLDDDEESPDCVAATAKVDDFLDDVTAKCEADGDFCNITAEGIDNGRHVEDSQAVCVPATCHAEAKEAIEWLKEQMGDELEEAQSEAQQTVPADARVAHAHADLDECSNCTIHIHCGRADSADSGKQHHQLQDAVHLAHM